MTGGGIRQSPAVDRAPHRVVVVGGGFGGLYAVKSLRDPRVAIALIDRRNFHLFQPLLYQAATGWLSPSEVASPLRSVLRGRRDVDVLLGEAVAFDVAERHVRLADGGSVPYDSLIVSAGAETAYFGNDAWRDDAPGVKSVEDAVEIRRRLLLAFEAADREGDPVARAAALTFVVIGGGSTGVEMAGVIGELARDILRGEFRHVDPRAARIVLVHSRDRILPDFPEKLAAAAARDLGRIGVEIRLGARVVGVDEGGVDLRREDATERIESRCVIWAAGVRASGLADRLARATDGTLDGGGRIEVEPDLTVPGYPEIFAIGDMATVRPPAGPFPGIAPVAMQQGRFAAATIRRRLDGEMARRTFRYQDRGLLATIGRGAAVARIGPLSFDGFLAWIIWLFVHVLYLVEFQNRIVVVMRWAWDFFLHRRGARLITGSNRLRLRVPLPAASSQIARGAGPRTRDAVPTLPPARRFGRVGYERVRRERRPNQPVGR